MPVADVRKLAGMVSLSAALATPAGATGSNLFNFLDAPTLILARDTVQTTLEGRETGETAIWSVGGVASGAVTPLRTYRSESGHWCREFEEIVTLADGRTQRSVSVRCRSGDGTWKLTGG